MDAAKLESKVNKGYGKAALRIGYDNAVYRAQSATSTPIAPANKVATLKASFNAEDMKYSRPNKYGKATWWGVFDRTTTLVGDYLVGPDGTFFIASQQTILPTLMVECNETLDVLRPQTQTGVGALDYGGNIDATETPLMTGWPASVLQGTKGEKTETSLPGDVRSPWWLVLMPQYAGVIIESDDILKDNLGRRFVVSSAELTDAGWRMTAMQART